VALDEPAPRSMLWPTNMARVISLGRAESDGAVGKRRHQATHLPIVSSLPSLPTRQQQPPTPLQRAPSSGEPTRRHRFSSVRLGSRRSDVVTPRTLAAAEIRLTAYLVQRNGQSATVSAPQRGRRSSTTITAELERADSSPAQEASATATAEMPGLRDLWEVKTSPLPIAPAPTVADEKLDPLSDEDAIEVLRQSSACASLETPDLQTLLLAGTRRLFPRYSVPMREGAMANGVFIVLQGKLHVQPSRIEIQAYQRLHQHGDGASDPEEQNTISGTIAEPSMFFGEENVLLTLPRLRTAIALEDTELLVVSDAQLAQLGPTVAEDVRHCLRSSFSASALKCVPFFQSLPELTRRQISTLLSLEAFKKGDTIFRQGDPGDPMYIVLYGSVDVWRTKKRGAAPEKIASYTGLSDFPWFGEVFTWVTEHGRAGDVICKEGTLTLTLYRARVPEFVLLAPGFRALAMSAASAFTIKSVKAMKRSEEDSAPVRMSEPMLRYGVQWVRIVGKLLGWNTMGSVAMIRMQEVRKKHANSMQWVRDVAGDPNVALEPDEDVDPNTAGFTFEEQQRRLLVRAHQKQFGDARTLAETAITGKSWRADWGVAWRVRTELLRGAAFRQELALARQAHTPERLPESFPKLAT